MKKVIIYIKSKLKKIANDNFLRNDLKNISMAVLKQYFFYSFLVILLILFCVYIYQYFKIFDSTQLSEDINDFSGFGSYLSGIGSIFSVVSLFFIILTYHNDKEDTKHQNEENKINRYFDYLVNIKKDVKITYKNKDIIGMSLFQDFTDIIFIVKKYNDKTKKRINGKVLDLNQLRSYEIRLVSVLIPLTQVFAISLEFILIKTKYISRKNTLELLLALFSFEELHSLIFCYIKIKGKDDIFLQKLISQSSIYKEIYDTSVEAIEVFNKTRT